MGPSWNGPWGGSVVYYDLNTFTTASNTTASNTFGLKSGDDSLSADPESEVGALRRRVDALCAEGRLALQVA